MVQLEPLQVGVMFWTGSKLDPDTSPDEIGKYVKSLGVSCGQLGIHGRADLGSRTRQAWKDAFNAHDLTVVTVFPAFQGESYADILTVQKTVGYIPRTNRAEREQRTPECSDFAKTSVSQVWRRTLVSCLRTARILTT